MIDDFFFIQPQEENCIDKIFSVLKNNIDYDSAYIYFINPDELKYSDNGGSDPLSILQQDLKIKKAVFGKIVITKKTLDFYNISHEKIFKTCSLIISNIIKDIELTEIINMQIKALQDGILERNKAFKKVIKADKIKNDFLSNISHELRTPLNSIIGFSESLSCGILGTLNPKQKEYIEDIRISGLHLLGMINEILDISKIEAGAIKLNLKEFNLNQAITEAVNIIKPLSDKKSIEISFLIDAKIQLSADYQKIQQVLFNLLGNAVKFTSENGKVIISASCDKKFVVLKITDTGIGIPKKFQKKIFEKFEQIQIPSLKNESSTGLGLTITKELVKLHGGKIIVDSEINKGSTFSVFLPLSKD